MSVYGLLIFEEFKRVIPVGSTESRYIGSLANRMIVFASKSNINLSKTGSVISGSNCETISLLSSPRSLTLLPFMSSISDSVFSR